MKRIVAASVITLAFTAAATAGPYVPAGMTQFKPGGAFVTKPVAGGVAKQGAGSVSKQGAGAVGKQGAALKPMGGKVNGLVAQGGGN